MSHEKQFTHALGLLEEYPLVVKLSCDKEDRMYKDPISNWAFSPVAKIDQDLFVAAQALEVPFTIKSFLHKKNEFRVLLKSLESPWCCVDIPATLLSQETIKSFWLGLSKPVGASAFSLAAPSSMAIQKNKHMSCYWRSISALLGGDSVFPFEWLQTMTAFFAWRGFPSFGAATQLTSKDPVVFGNEMNQ